MIGSGYSTAGSASTGTVGPKDGGGPNAHVSSGAGALETLDIDGNSHLQPGVQAPDNIRGKPTYQRIWSDTEDDRRVWPTVFERFPGYGPGADMLKLMYDLYPLATKVRLSMLSEDKNLAPW